MSQLAGHTIVQISEEAICKAAFSTRYCASNWPFAV